MYRNGRMSSDVQAHRHSVFTLMNLAELVHAAAQRASMKLSTSPQIASASLPHYRCRLAPPACQVSSGALQRTHARHAHRTHHPRPPRFVAPTHARSHRLLGFASGSLARGLALRNAASGARLLRGRLLLVQRLAELLRVAGEAVVRVRGLARCVPAADATAPAPARCSMNAQPPAASSRPHSA